MKAIITAAGMGTRIAQNIAGKHKCTLDISDGTPLICYTVKTLLALGIGDISVIVGYRRQEIETVLEDTPVKIYCNPFYYLTNSIGSLYFARQEFDGSSNILIMNGDTFVERALYEAICSHAASPLLVVDSSRKNVADVKVHVENRLVTHYGKEIAATVTAESTDIVKVNREHTVVYREMLERMLDQRYHDKYWEDVLMAENGKLPVNALDTNGLFWSEIDFIEDYARVMGFTGRQV